LALFLASVLFLVFALYYWFLFFEREEWELYDRMALFALSLDGWAVGNKGKGW
jgi:hypothetical protein